MRYALNDEVQSRFLSPVELPGGTAPEIVGIVLNFFSLLGVFVV